MFSHLILPTLNKAASHKSTRVSMDKIHGKLLTLECLRIDTVWWDLATQPGDKVSCCHSSHVGSGGDTGTGNVRRDDYVVQSE